MILAGDVGGTRTRLGLFEPRAERPEPVSVHEYSTGSFSDLDSMIATFLRDAGGPRIRTAGFGVAGPVSGNRAALTNVPWQVDGHELARTLAATVSILNDLQAMAYGVPLLRDAELHVLQQGERRDGNIALVAAGTGLGEALLHLVDGRFVPSPSEAGHADFAARTEREIALVQNLTRRFGRASVEHVLSGHGLINLHQITHSAPCRAIESTEVPDAPAAITKAGLEHRCSGCVAALEMFVEAYGAEAGNLALRSVSTAGLFVGGGIARRILPALTDGRFLRAFTAKAPFEDMLRRMPVKVILNDQAGLLGAAAYAAQTCGIDSPASR
jgi:glucokinase